MKEQFDLREFLQNGGVIYTPYQEEWLFAFDLIKEFGMKLNFNPAAYPKGAEDYPYIAMEEWGGGNRVTAYSERRDPYITYLDLVCRLGIASEQENYTAASPSDILSMLYRETGV